MIEQHGGDDARVARVVVGEIGVRGVGAAEPGAGRGGLGDRGGHLLAVRGEHGRQHLAQRSLFGVGVQQVDVRLEGVDVEGREQVGGLRRGPESAQTVELRERADEFGLVVGVLVVAVRGVDRDAPALLVLVPLLGLGEVGVHLEGEGAPAARSLRRNGRRGPNLATAARPSSFSGASSITSVSGPRRVREGAPGWAPIHISACGSPVGSTPRRRGMAVVEPQA